MLSFVPFLVIVAFVSLIGDLYSCRPDGVMRRQLSSMADTKNERSFTADDNGLDLGRFLLIFQWCLCFGLILFTRTDADFFQHLQSPDGDTWLRLVVCVSIPAVWFFGQWILYSWWSYLFHLEGKASILTRIYKALHMLAAPVALMVFMFELTGWLSASDSWILLVLTFIIAQIAFIFSGIKIFWSGIGTLCFIFLYLCAFKLAPFLLLWAKLG